MQAPDWLYRFVYRHGVRLARLWWWLRRPRTSGAHLLMWHEGCVLLLRTSYRSGWTTPGGAIKRGETPVDAALREEPALTIDNREIVEARFVPLAETQSFALAAPFREYLNRKVMTTRNVSTHRE